MKINSDYILSIDIDDYEICKFGKTYSMSCKNITAPTTTTTMLLTFVPSRSGFGKSTHYVRKAKKLIMQKLIMVD